MQFDELFASDALLLGRITYQEFVARWPSMQGTGKYGERMNSLPSLLGSHHALRMEWNSRVAHGRSAEEFPGSSSNQGRMC